MTFPLSEASMPPLPPKGVVSKFRPKFLEQRRIGLQYFLKYVDYADSIAIHTLTSQTVVYFLTLNFPGRRSWRTFYSHNFVAYGVRLAGHGCKSPMAISFVYITPHDVWWLGSVGAEMTCVWLWSTWLMIISCLRQNHETFVLDVYLSLRHGFLQIYSQQLLHVVIFMIL